MLTTIKLIAAWLFDRLILPWMTPRTPKIPPGHQDGEE